MKNISLRKASLVALALGVAFAALGAFGQTAMSGLSPTSGDSTPPVDLSSARPLSVISAFSTASTAPLLGSSLSSGVRSTFEHFNKEPPPANAPAELTASLPGTVDIAQARALVSSGPTKLVGAPTANSRVCLALDDGEYAGCTSALTTAGVSIDKATFVATDGTLTRFVLYGIAADGIRSIAVRFLDGHTEPATLSNNAYLYDDPAPSKASGIDALLVTATDGVTSVPIP